MNKVYKMYMYSSSKKLDKRQISGNKSHVMKDKRGQLLTEIRIVHKTTISSEDDKGPYLLNEELHKALHLLTKQ